MRFDRMLARVCAPLLALAIVIAAALPARASQDTVCLPTTGTLSGLTLVNDLNSALSAIFSSSAGASGPNDPCLGGSAPAGMWWLDTSVSPNRLKIADGTGSWTLLGYVDPTNHLFTPITGGGPVNSVASASTTDLCSTPPTYVSVTGTTTITSFGSNCTTGQIKVVVFAASLTLTHNATSLILPNNGVNVVTQAGDVLIAVYLGGGNWRVMQYQAASGAALNASSNFQGAVYMNSGISPSSLSTSQNNWNPSGLSTANLIRVSSSANINITGLNAPATPGQRVTIQNINAAAGNTVTLTSNDTNSSIANRFCFPHPVGLIPNQSLAIVYDSTSTCWRLDQVIRAQPAAGSFKNLKIVNNSGGTPNNQLTVTADELTVEDVNGGAVRLSLVNCMADITTNSFSSGLGGLDTGSVSQNTGYYLWVIYAPATNTQSCLFSTASTFGGIALPSGYLFAARVGWDFVENAVGKRFNRILCYGRSCQYVITASSATTQMPEIGSGTATAWTALSTANFVPATASKIKLVLISSIAGGSEIEVAPNNAYSTSLALATSPPCAMLNNNASTVISSLACEMTLESSNIYWGTSGSVILSVLGWEDNL